MRISDTKEKQNSGVYMAIDSEEECEEEKILLFQLLPKFH
jgi:hypothetical protein